MWYFWKFSKIVVYSEVIFFFWGYFNVVLTNYYRKLKSNEKRHHEQDHQIFWRSHLIPRICHALHSPFHRPRNPHWPTSLLCLMNHNLILIISISFAMNILTINHHNFKRRNCSWWCLIPWRSHDKERLRPLVLAAPLVSMNTWKVVSLESSTHNPNKRNPILI